MTKETTFEDLSIVIPAYNEEDGLKITLPLVKEAFPKAEIIVVNDCSTDKTIESAKLFKDVSIISHDFNRGQGAALSTGMLAATKKYVAWFDADNEHRTQDLLSLYNSIKDNNRAAVIGQRTGRSANWIRGSGKWLVRLIGRSFKINAGSDLNCGLRIFRRDIILSYLHLIPQRFSASMITTLIVIERGYPIAFEPVETNSRVGFSTVRLKDGFEAILWMLRAVMLFAPIRIFLPTGLAMIALGSLYSFTIAVLIGSGLPVAGMLVILTGVLFIMLGLIADQISQFRLSQIPFNKNLARQYQKDIKERS
ncbi:MAG: hypothetical protein CMH31_05455 [Micavibrio sp.]|nr:hypothetical protein [Micavibrio sp.]|tara:strand:- start:1131 stop:2057 length:927 start_codon:yes stop_codon:yes gene_type:complete